MCNNKSSVSHFYSLKSIYIVIKIKRNSLYLYMLVTGRCKICTRGENCRMVFFARAENFLGDIFARVDFFYYHCYPHFLPSVDNFFFLFYQFVLQFTLNHFQFFLLPCKNYPLCKIVTRAKLTLDENRFRVISSPRAKLTFGAIFTRFHQ